MNNQTSMTDEKLIQFYLIGDPNAMATLVELYKDRVYQYIFNIVQDKFAAEVIFQDAFICIINNMIAGKTAEEGNFLQWAIRIAQNLCVEHFRKIKVKRIIRTTDGSDLFELLNFAEPNAEDKIIRTQSSDRIMKLVSELPEEQREIIFLRHYADLKFREISKILNCSVNTALGRMRYALQSLRKKIEERQIAI